MSDALQPKASQQSQPSLRDALAWARSVHPVATENQTLLLHTLGSTGQLHQSCSPSPSGLERIYLITHDHERLSAEQWEHYQMLVKRLAEDEPLAYIRGEIEFYALMFHLTPATLIPRADTETLVTWALERLNQTSFAPGSNPTALDLGTGSGCIACALKYNSKKTTVWATDISPEALTVARRNADRHRLNITFKEGSWFDALERDSQRAQTRGAQQFDLIVSNPPYIALGDPHLEQLRFEPMSALVSGPTGLSDALHIISKAPAYLKKGGALLIEHGYDQARAVQEIFHNCGFQDVQSRTDIAGILRCTAGVWLKDGIMEP